MKINKQAVKETLKRTLAKLNPVKWVVDARDSFFDAILYRGTVGAVYWHPEDDPSLLHSHEADGYMIVRSSEGTKEIPFAIANRWLAKRPNRAMLLSVNSQAVLDGMNPTAYRIGKLILSPYNRELLKERDFWPEEYCTA